MSEDNLPQRQFAVGEPERLVTQLRASLRNNDTPKAHSYFVPLANGLTRLIQSKAETFFNRRRDLIDDAIQEAIFLLWNRLSDLRDLPGLRHFERRFYQALDSLTQDAFRRVYRRARVAYETADSATQSPEETDTPQTALSTAPNLEATRSLEEVIGTMSMPELVKRIPDERHRIAFLLDLEGVPQKDIALRFGRAERTIYNWIEAAESSLRQYIEVHYWEGHPDN